MTPVGTARVTDSRGNLTEREFSVSVGLSGAYSPPPEIDRTGEVDVAAALDAWIASVPDGSTIRMPEGVEYRCMDQIALTERWGLTIDFNGTTIRGEIKSRAGYFRLNGGGDLIFRGGSIIGGNVDGGPEGPDGTHGEYYQNHGIKVFNGAAGVTDGLLIEDMHIEQVWGDLVYVGGSPPARNITLRRLTGGKTGRHNLAFVSVDGLLVEGCDVGDARWSNIDLEPGSPTSQGVANVRIVNNVFGPARHYLLTHAGKMPEGDVEANVEFSENVQTHHTLAANLQLRAIASRGTYMVGYKINGNTFQRGFPGMARIKDFEVLDNLLVGDRENDAPANIDTCRDCHHGVFRPLAEGRVINWTLGEDSTDIRILSPGEEL